MRIDVVPFTIGLVPVTLLSVLMATPLITSADTATVSSSLVANLSAVGAVSVPALAILTSAGSLFNAFSGTALVQYRARSSVAGGGALTLKVIQDFQAGGPSVANGDLTYSCGAAGLGTACGSTTASTSSATSVVMLPASACTGGGSPCSAADPNTIIVTFVLADRPGVQTGTFTANIQFTISAT